MNSPIEYNGEFFLPREEARCINGILKIDGENGTELELIGGLSAMLDKKTARPLPATILGILENGEKVTLLECLDSVDT